MRSPDCNKREARVQVGCPGRCRSKFFHREDKLPDSALPGSYSNKESYEESAPEIQKEGKKKKKEEIPINR